MKKRSIIFLSAAAIAALLCLGAARSPSREYAAILEVNWGLALPAKAHYTQVYQKDSGASFHGDGIRYHVFSYKDPEPIRELLDWSDSEGKTIYYASYREAAAAWLSSIQVPAEELPDYSACVYWYASQTDNSEIILLWDAGKSRLYAAESFL
jgi:hypothetical protein